MKSILSRGGIEFLAVFLGIVLSLWVDDYRENKELNERLMEDYKKIYLEVNSNITNIENIISQNENYKENEEHLLKILNKESLFNFDKVISLIKKINTPTFFGEETAYKSSVSSGRLNTSKNDLLTRQISLLYEHYFKRLELNGDYLDKYMMNFTKDYAIVFNKARFNQNDIDTLYLKNYFFSDTFHNGLLDLYDMRKNWYLLRLYDTKSQLYKVKDYLTSFQ